MNDTPAAMRAEASARLSSLFLGILARGGVTFEEFGGLAIAGGNALIAAAMGMALELFDGERCGSLPGGQRVHDRRERRLATEAGDVRFKCRRVRDERGNTVVPLADALDLPWGAACRRERGPPSSRRGPGSPTDGQPTCSRATGRACPPRR